MIPKSCRLFGQDHATEQMLRAKSRFNLKRFRSMTLQRRSDLSPSDGSCRWFLLSRVQSCSRGGSRCTYITIICDSPACSRGGCRLSRHHRFGAGATAKQGALSDIDLDRVGRGAARRICAPNTSGGRTASPQMSRSARKYLIDKITTSRRRALPILVPG
jgi:hypothetical protein